jgi:phosphatidyl-myo-inositol alpha-mannosyltransferase
MRVKPKIIISNYDDVNNPFYGGGGARAIHAVAKRLAEKYRIVILTSRFPGSKDEVVDGVKYKRIGMTLFGPKLGQLLYHFSLIKHIFSEEFDAWLESFTPPFSTSFLPLFTKKPVLGLVHMLTAEDMVRKYKLPFHHVENFGLGFYKHFIVLNNTTRKKISIANKDAKFFVIPNGVDLPNQNKIKNSRRTHILFIGRIEINQKGLDLLLNSFKLISGRTRKKLIIAGSGTPKENRTLRNLVNSLGLSHKVEIAGRVSGKKWEKILKGAWVVVIPSRYETFPLVALEALAYGSPVVSFNIEGLGWLPGTVSLKARKFNNKQLSEHILALSSDTKERRRLVRNIPKFINSYSWDNIAVKYDQAMEEVLLAKK